MMQTYPAPIVVGVDGSAASLAALRWAAAEAAVHGAPLVAVRVHDPRNRQRAPYAQTHLPDVDDHGGAAAIAQLIGETAEQPVDQVIEIGVPSEVLVRHAASARMLVLGHAEHLRHHDGEPFRSGPVLGAIARACVAGATCAVVVVPIPERQSAPSAADPEPRRVPEPAGARALYPRVRTTAVGRG